TRNRALSRSSRSRIVILAIRPPLINDCILIIDCIGGKTSLTRLTHERLALDLVGFRIAPLGAQRVGQQPACLSLGGTIAAGQTQRLASASFRLMRVAIREPQPPALDPQQRIVRLDAQGAV